MSKRQNYKISVPKRKIIKPSQAQTNRIRNGGFENPTLRPWVPSTPASGSIFLTRVNPHSGAQAVRIIALPNQRAFISQNTLHLRRRRTYLFSVWVRRVTSSTAGEFRARIGGLTLVFPLSLIPVSSYRQFTQGVLVSSSTSLPIELISLSTSSDALVDLVIDDVSFSLVTNTNTRRKIKKFLL